MSDSSGLDSLLEALRQSGVNVDDMTKGAGSSSTSSNTGGSSEKAKQSSSGDAKARWTGGAGRGGNPFSGNPFNVGNPFNMGNVGGRGSQEDGGSSDDAGSGSGSGGSNISEFVDSMASWSKSRRVWAIIIVIIILLAAYWWFHPPISVNSGETWLFVAIFILLPLFLVFRSRSRAYETGTMEVDPNQGKFKLFRVLMFVPVAVLVIGLLGGLLSLDLFPGNAHKYATVLQTQQLDFADDIQEVDYSQIPVIDHDSAVLLGNREMGSIPDYVSQFEVDDLYSQINYQSSPVRVSPLGYADLFKWLTNRGDGIPAYALVNMTTQDAQIVRLPEGQGMKYTPSEPLARNIDRYVQLKYPFYIFDQKAFEIDEDGHPWWTCPVRSYTIGLFGGETISRVVLCDAVTGECQDLAIDDVPEWVDRAYPSDLLIRQYNWSGRYINGWFNSWLGQSGVYQTTPGDKGELGYNYVAKDDDVWVYTGVTSATSDSSIIGFVLINQRTAESHFYAVSGATEDSAMDSAEGQVQNLRYTATFPLLINVSNQPTYFMALKDSAGLVKQFAMLDIQRYQNVAVGNTVAECQKSYEALLAQNGVVSASDAASALNLKTATGTIRTMAQATIDGNSHFYVTLDAGGAIYDFALPSLIGIVGYQPGDQISFSYVEGDPTNTAQELLDSSGNVVGGSIGSSSSGTQNAGSSGSAGSGSSGSSSSSSSRSSGSSSSSGGQTAVAA